MAGKSKAEREALERQNAAITAVFERAGFDYIAPDIIQPADIFLERSGEDIRARTFVFTDPAGAEMCLRPDLTVPACRYHLSHAEKPDEEAKYCYLGSAFRFPNEHLSPQEFLQAGLEWFAAPDAAAAEARVLKLAISALEAAGLTKFRVTLGDLGLFSALLEDTPMPVRWRNRLKHHFWRPHAFREVLESFTTNRGAKRTSISALIDRLATEPVAEVVAREIESKNLPLVGGRSLDEIAARLADKSADRSEAALDQAKADAITGYLNIVERADNLEGVPEPDRAAAATLTRRGSIFKSASRKWKSLASAPSALNSRPPSAVNLNTTPALSSRLKLKHRKASSPWPVAGVTTISSPTWAHPSRCPPWVAPFTPSA